MQMSFSNTSLKTTIISLLILICGHKKLFIKIIDQEETAKFL